MSEYGANRQRNTNKLVRLVASFVFSRKTISPDQLYGICKLTWITNNSLSDDAAYISSTKIPALGEIFREDFSKLDLSQVAVRVSELLADPSAIDIVKEHTGFTNFYKAYRNSSKDWIEQNSRFVSAIFRAALNLSTDQEGLALVKRLEKLTGISKANYPDIKMRPEYLLTPALFALDNRLRFPLINGNKGVRNLLQALGVSNAPLHTQYTRMVEQYGQGGIQDAADLDQAGHDLPEFISIHGTEPTKQLLIQKPVIGASLPLKDEGDVQSIQSAMSIASRRLHNSLTNKLRVCLPFSDLYEGRDKQIMFDAMVKNFNGNSEDLLIEVKSSVEIAHIRMAVGQLYSYSFRLKAKQDPRLAILLPGQPASDIKAWLESLDIGLLWFSGSELYTSDDWLFNIANEG